jgi:hypothetical protein
MKTYTYSKLVNPDKLRQELLNASFASPGTATYKDGKVTEVLLPDTETKDPSPVVNAHVCLGYKEIDWAAEWEKAKTTAQQTVLLAKEAGIIPLTFDEMEQGTLADAVK